MQALPSDGGHISPAEDEVVSGSFEATMMIEVTDDRRPIAPIFPTKPASLESQSQASDRAYAARRERPSAALLAGRISSSLVTNRVYRCADQRRVRRVRFLGARARAIGPGGSRYGLRSALRPTADAGGRESGGAVSETPTLMLWRRLMRVGFGGALRARASGYPPLARNA
jgi:hypothetical protein